MIALRTSGAPWPALVTSTPDDQSSQRFPYLSSTKISSARSHTTGGMPRIEIGSKARSFSSVGSESGCGSALTMRRYLVSTRGTSRGMVLYSLPMGGVQVSVRVRKKPYDVCDQASHAVLVFAT